MAAANRELGTTGIMPRLKAFKHRLSNSVITSNRVNQSTHGADCFSSDHFYNQQVDANRNDYITNASDFMGPDGDLNLNFGVDNMSVDPKDNLPGYFCDKCHSGIKFKEDGNTKTLFKTI